MGSLQEALLHSGSAKRKQKGPECDPGEAQQQPVWGQLQRSSRHPGTCAHTRSASGKQKGLSGQVQRIQHRAGLGEFQGRPRARQACPASGPISTGPHWPCLCRLPGSPAHFPQFDSGSMFYQSAAMVFITGELCFSGLKHLQIPTDRESSP